MTLNSIEAYKTWNESRVLHISHSSFTNNSFNSSGNSWKSWTGACHHAWIVFQVPRFCALNPLLFHFTAVCVFLLLLFISWSVKVCIRSSRAALPLAKKRKVMLVRELFPSTPSSATAFGRAQDARSSAVSLCCRQKHVVSWEDRGVNL